MEDKGVETNKKESKVITKNILSKENVNIGRQPEFDYLKTLIILLMLPIHVYENYSRNYISEIIEFIGIFLGAPGFMLLMGIGMKYTRHQDLNNYISRGFILFTKGLYVNLLKNALPNLISWWSTGKKIFISRALLIIQTDILMFAGFCFLFVALMKKMKLSDNYILSIGFIMNIIGFFLYKIIKSLNNFLLNQFLAYFVLTDADSYFPFFSYFIFVASGYWLGGIYLRVSNKDKFYNFILFLCLPTATIYYYLRSYNFFPILPEFCTDEHYVLHPGPDAIATIMINLACLSIFHKIEKIIKGKTPKFITKTAQNLNQYYTLSYLITMHINIFLRATRGDNFPSKIKYPTLLAIIIFVICKISIDINDKYIHFTIDKLKNPIRNFVFAFIWIMTIISLIYIYPKVEVYTTYWNNYLYEI